MYPRCANPWTRNGGSVSVTGRNEAKFVNWRLSLSARSTFIRAAGQLVISKRTIIFDCVTLRLIIEQRSSGIFMSLFFFTMNICPFFYKYTKIIILEERIDATVFRIKDARNLINKVESNRFNGASEIKDWIGRETSKEIFNPINGSSAMYNTILW